MKTYTTYNMIKLSEVGKFASTFEVTISPKVLLHTPGGTIHKGYYTSEGKALTGYFVKNGKDVALVAVDKIYFDKLKDLSAEVWALAWDRYMSHVWK